MGRTSASASTGYTSRSSFSSGTPGPAASTQGTAAHASGILRMGSRGSSVSSLQNSLRAAGFNPGKTDGIFGPKTQTALHAFQASKGLKADGLAGPKTLGALRDMDSFQAARPAVARPNPTPRPAAPASAQSAAPISKLPSTGNAFMDRIAADAIASQRRTGVPASVTMAQAALESNWGKSGLSTHANNFFGIKGKGPEGSVNMRTREVFHGKETYVNAPFRAYSSPAQSFDDHGKFLTGNRRYGTAMQHTNDPHRFAQEIARAGYATDPQYASKLSGMINKYGLERFDRFGGE
ncbi:glycoside hydrolase family 73 protein [Corallococcus exercitus]|uniref:glycoside hydrolase family 73 protein n=1 Tax=Corallococcus exercitus TaxID=2316736 RepID=UPI001ABFD4ED|nr:glucosaminidase domain-containing protein [Corallococcus exercitus]